MSDSIKIVLAIMTICSAAFIGLVTGIVLQIYSMNKMQAELNKKREEITELRRLLRIGR